MKKNSRSGNRSRACSLTAFKKFFKCDFISAADITESLYERFRNHLLDNQMGETPADYFMRFKRMLKAASKQGYFRQNPATDVKAKAKTSVKKEILEAHKYHQLMNTFCFNYGVKKAAIFVFITASDDAMSVYWSGHLSRKTQL